MSTLLVVRLAAENGISEEEILDGTALTAATLSEPTSEVTPDQELRAIRNLLASVDSPETIGLDAGLLYHLTTYGIWGFAMASASTFRESVDVGLRYLGFAYSFAPIRAEEQGDEFRLILDEPDLPTEIVRFLVQRDAAAFHTLQRDVLGWPVRPLALTFRHTPSAEAMERYREVFGIVPTFGAERNVIVVDTKALDGPLPQADEHTAAMTQQMCAELLDARRAREGLAGRVRDLIVAQLRHPPSVLEVAQTLQMSPRTLRRHLSNEDTSLRQLIDEVRQTLASELIVGGRLTVSEIASRLGYLEVSSFSQAFRRWYGTSPRNYAKAFTPVRARPISNF